VDPLSPGPSGEWLPTEDEAKTRFREEVERLEADGPRILRVERIEDGEAVEEKFVVRRDSTYRGGTYRGGTYRGG
jgi:hypothetical protein